MSEPNATQRLAAILMADVVGYSALMGNDEPATRDAMKDVFNSIIDPAVRSAKGTIVEVTGDGYLIEFASAIEAIGCALQWQEGLRKIKTDAKDRIDLRFRIGINLGEVLFRDGSISGDVVNIAARLETICPPGEICVSEMTRLAVGSHPRIQFEDFAVHRLKNIKTPVHAFLVSQDHLDDEPAPRDFGAADQSRTRYCRAKDGISIAHARVGKGYPLVITGSVMTHLEMDWDAPSYGDLLASLARHFNVIRYDQRGCGMSDRDNVEIEFERLVDDLEAVIDVYDCDKVAVMGMSGAASASIAYALRRPEKVSHLILQGGYARGRLHRGGEGNKAESEAFISLLRLRWAADNPGFRHMMTALFMPDASAEEANWFNKFQQATASGETMARYREVSDDVDISDILGDVKVPSLIIHSDEDAVAPLAEGKLMASRIAGAEFIRLKSRNHLLFANEPEFPRLIRSICEFVV